MSLRLHAPLALALAACGAATPDGMALYENPWSSGSTYACATCHALSPDTPADPDALRLVGHPLTNVLARPSYKNGQLARPLDAVNSCLTEWMNTDALAATDPRWQALEAFFGSQATGRGRAVTFAVVQPPADLGGGDAARGQATFNRTCASCHGQGGVGSLVGPPLAGVAPAASVVARRVRTSGLASSAVYPGLTGGIMPFWSADRLSDDELRDLIAWLPTTTPVSMMPTETGVDLSVSTAQASCGRTHPLVGKKATLTTFAHRVSGTVEVVDDCTLRLTGFSYDGGGIDVRLYGGKGGAYRAGAALSRNFLGTRFDSGTATVRLPTGVSLDALDGVSVWCVAVGVSFGDGLFR